MNDETAFQAHLDAHPGDHTARLVFADWLQERGDPRELGHRALVAQKKWAWLRPYGWVFFNAKHYAAYHPNIQDMPHQLPAHWFAKAFMRSLLWKSHATRQWLEDEVALAFIRLPKTQRTKLLTQGAVA